MSDVMEGADESLKGWKARRKEGTSIGRVREWTVNVSILISTEHSDTSNQIPAPVKVYFISGGSSRNLIP